jgi:lysophospholipase L1-like esterase
MTETLRNNDITPVFQKLFYQHDNSKFNDSIDSLNRSLSQYCLRENIDLIDIGKEMHDAMGLKANLTTDNLHLNQNGYLIWEDALKNYLKHK